MVDGFLDEWGWLSVAFAVFAGVGWLLAVRVPRNPLGWLLMVVGCVPLATMPVQVYATVALIERAGALPAGEVAAWAGELPWAGVWTAFALVLLLFPDGRPVSPRWRPVVWATAANAALVTVLGGIALWPQRAALVGDQPEAVGPFGPLALLAAVGHAGVGLAMVAGAASLIVRYRRRRGIERAQLKWIALAAVGVVPAVAAAVARDAGVVVPAVAEALTFVPIVGVPVAVAVAVLRYRLYEIDRIVSRTVAYALLTALLVGVYAGAVVGLQTLLAPLLGEGSEVAAAGATLAAAALFGPLRRRVQSAVDRRFNRARYDAEQVVASFRERLRDEVELADVATATRSAVVRTVEPTWASLWLRGMPPESGTIP